MTEDNAAPSYTRLCDKILESLNLALDQKDAGIADTLARALEASVTRNAGGQGFIERRQYPEEVLQALDRLENLKAG